MSLDVQGPVLSQEALMAVKQLNAIADPTCALEVAVIEGCGVVEVQVSGPDGTLRVDFDQSQLVPAFVRHVLRRRLREYGASLGCRPDRKNRRRKEARR